jgi:hypothetical protein
LPFFCIHEGMIFMSKNVSADRQEIDILYARADMMQQGTSKYEAKNEVIDRIGTTDRHQVGGEMSFHSYRTADTQKQAVTKLYSYAKENFNIKSPRSITGTVVTRYLKDCSNRGLAESTIARNIIPSIEKFDDVLNKAYGAGENGIKADFHSSCENFKSKHISTENTYVNRAFENPKSLVDALPDTVKICGTLQHEYGLRVSSACNLIKIDEGKYCANTKEGQKFIISPKPEHCRQIDSKLNGNVFHVSQSEYRNELRNAANLCGEDFAKCGTHGLRYNFAQSRYSELIQQGYSVKSSRIIVSEELGHHRDYMGPYLGK